MTNKQRNWEKMKIETHRNDSEIDQEMERKNMHPYTHRHTDTQRDTQIIII